MNPQDVLLQLLDENDYYIRDLLDNASAECLHWRPEPSANSIVVLVWHVSRVQDVFYTQHVLGLEQDAERWFTQGWAAESGYDPRGIGVNGWGMLANYTAEEVDAIPPMSAELLRRYYDHMNNLIRTYLADSSVDELLENAVGFEGKQTNWFWVRHPIFDMSRHVGEMLLIQGLWQRTGTTS